ncbi:hypothetical protein BGZ95_008584, partial [Linnemannia exigua]
MTLASLSLVVYTAFLFFILVTRVNVSYCTRLDKVRYGRTTIVIPHRYSSIQNADLILTVNDGAIIESGRHCELVRLSGVFIDLCKKQMPAL